VHRLDKKVGVGKTEQGCRMCASERKKREGKSSGSSLRVEMLRGIDRRWA